MFSVAGARALISGGASGIGAAVAQALTEAGCHVIAADLPGAPLPTDRRIETAEVDVTDKASVRALAAGLDRLDILVNAAGTIRRGTEYEPDVFARVLDVNLVGVMRLCTACRPLLARQGGSIVNIASMLSFFGGGLVPGYSASKGVAQLTKSLAIGWAGEDIRVNAVAPGWIATPLTQALQDDPDRSATILARTPLGRWGRPEDVTGAVIFLCSPAAAFITGAILPVDGGYLIT